METSLFGAKVGSTSKFESQAQLSRTVQAKPLGHKTYKLLAHKQVLCDVCKLYLSLLGNRHLSPC